MQDRGKEIEAERSCARDHHGEEVLPLDTDVEEPGLEAHRKRERGEHERRRGGEDRSERGSISEREVEDRAVDLDRVGAVSHGDQRAGEQGHAERDQERDALDDRGVDPGRAGAYRRDRCRAGSHQLASFASVRPSMPRAISSGPASGRYSPVIRPS